MEKSQTNMISLVSWNPEQCMHGELVDGRKLAGSRRMWKDMLRIKNDLGEVV